MIGDLAPESGGPSPPPVALGEAVTLQLFAAGFPRAWLTSWPLKQGLERLVPEADVVHIHSLYLYLFHCWSAGTLCRKLGIPYIVRPHGTLDPYIRRRHRWRKLAMELWFQNQVLRDAAAIHYTSAEERRLAEPFVRGAPGSVVPLGLDLADYAHLPPPGSFRALYPETGARPILLFLSRLNFKKGLDILIEAAAHVVAAGIDAHLVIAGPDGGMEAAARRWVAQAGLAPRTTFTGMLTGRAKLAAFRDASLFVLPSSSENFGIAVVEAMACGTPVLVSDRVNIWREIVEDGAGVAEPPKAHRFAAAALRLMRDEPLRLAMGRAARDCVARRYQWRDIAAELERLYQRLAAGRLAGATPCGIAAPC